MRISQAWYPPHTHDVARMLTAYPCAVCKTPFCGATQAGGSDRLCTWCAIWYTVVMTSAGAVY